MSSIRVFSRFMTASETSSCMSSARRPAPALERDQGPHRFHQAKGPCSLQKPVQRGHRAGPGKTQDKDPAARLQSVKDQHRGDCSQPEQRKRSHVAPSRRSLQPVARRRVSDCDKEENDCAKNHQQVHVKVLSFPALKLHHHRKPQSRFIVSEVRAEPCRPRDTGKAGSGR